MLLVESTCSSHVLSGYMSYFAHWGCIRTHKILPPICPYLGPSAPAQPHRGSDFFGPELPRASTSRAARVGKYNIHCSSVFKVYLQYPL